MCSLAPRHFVSCPRIESCLSNQIHRIEGKPAGGNGLATVAPVPSRVSRVEGRLQTASGRNESTHAPAADERIERPLVQVIVAPPAIDETPTLQHLKPTYDRSAGHAHVGSNLSDRKRLALDVANGHACGKPDREATPQLRWTHPLSIPTPSVFVSRRKKDQL